MTTTDNDPGGPPPGLIYQAFWRWHFYAGLLVLPVLMLMALTGGFYLFQKEIDGILYRNLLTTPARPIATAPRAWADAARARVPGRVMQLTPPAHPGLSARIIVQPDAGGERRAVYVDPHDAKVLGDIPDGGIMHLVKRLHSLEIAGPVANIAVEIVAGWAIVLAATGLVLWWPRGRKGGVVSVRGGTKQRVFWRDLHAVTGVFAGLVIVFLAVTGMPWSAVWGDSVRKLTNQAGWGRPAAPASAAAWSHGPDHKPAEGVPWALQEGDMHAGHHAPLHDMAASLTLDGAVAKVEASGLGRPYVLSPPREPGKAWSAAYMPDKVEATRTLYLDPGNGKVLADIGYDRFGPAAQAIEWGIAVHQGQQFGLVNKLVMLAGCIAIWLLAISGLVMWWKRRPTGRLAAPARPTDARVYWALAAVVAPLAILYPLVGASLLAVLILDLFGRTVVRALRPHQDLPS